MTAIELCSFDLTIKLLLSNGRTEGELFSQEPQEQSQVSRLRQYQHSAYPTLKRSAAVVV